MKWLFLFLFSFSTAIWANDFDWVLKLPVIHKGVCLQADIPAPCAIHWSEEAIYIVFIGKAWRGYTPLSIHKIKGKELELLWINPDSLI